MYDVIIIGGGPAGITAGIYCKRANLKTIIFEKEAIGGQIASSPLVENFPGCKSISGAQLATNFLEQAEELGVEIEIEEVLEIIPGKINKVKTDFGEYESKVVIIATGSKYRLLGLPKEVDFIGKGIAFCTSCDGAFFKGKTVAVIGGGNSAVGNALYMANLCKKVYLIDICDHLICEKTLEAKLRSLDNVEIIQETGVKELLGDDELKGIKLTNDRVIDLDGMFISIGMVAQTDLVKDLVKLSPQKYIDSEDCTTEKNGIFVAGDCRTKNIRQLTTAVADGTTAAINAIKYIENYK
ncbi:MAG: FAD-dependent oxidoreductase [Bacilli bacterium]|nr:FAD-dependent oxidoreductase [Bacilli bacterium]